MGRAIKRTILLTFLLVMAFSSTAFAATTLYVNADSVNVRSTPSTSTKNNIIGKANKGDSCTYISESDDWTKVTINKQEGYIKSEYLQTEKITVKATANNTVKTNAKSSKASQTQNSAVVQNTVSTVTTGGGGQLVWIPTKGGKRYHSKSSCSGMDGPEQVTIEQAMNQGFTPCGKCYK